MFFALPFAGKANVHLQRREMFEKSERYIRLEAARDELTDVLRRDFITELIDFLYDTYERQNDTSEIGFLVWLGEKGSYREVYPYNAPELAPYDLVREASELFAGDDLFASAFQHQLNERHGEENAAMLVVKIEKVEPDLNDLHALITFKYDALWGYGD